MLEIDRRSFIASLGGAASVALLTHEARADALEDALLAQTDTGAPKRAAQPTAAAAPAATSAAPFPAADRQGSPLVHTAAARALFYNNGPDAKVERLSKMPAQPRSLTSSSAIHARNHFFSGATRRGGAEPTRSRVRVPMHDTVQGSCAAITAIGAVAHEPPYRAHRVRDQNLSLRFYEDKEAGPVPRPLPARVRHQTCPRRTCNRDKYVRAHRWYDAPREVTVSDLYAFDPNAVVGLEPFRDLIGRHFKQPKEGLGNDNSPVAHMWRTIANPDAPL
jgi:hypothetical protein